MIARDVVSWVGACTSPGSAPALVPQDLLAGGVRMLLALPRLASLSGHITEVSTQAGEALRSWSGRWCWEGWS